MLETPPPPNYTDVDEVDIPATEWPQSWYFEREMFCYWCGRVTVQAGEAA